MSAHAIEQEFDVRIRRIEVSEPSPAPTYAPANASAYAAARASASAPDPGRAVLPAAIPRSSWIERLAQWVERQPQHHRLGSFQQRD